METKATRTFETSGTSYPATRRHSSPQQNCCTNCSHIPIPLSRAKFQKIQRAIWQSAHCMLLKYCVCSMHKERTAEMCRNDLLIAFALCSPICSPQAALGCTVTASHNCNMSLWQTVTDCPANCEDRDVTVRCSVVYHERKNQERKWLHMLFCVQTVLLEWWNRGGRSGRGVWHVTWCHVRRDVMSLGKSHPTFRNNLLHASSRLKSSWENFENIDGYAILLMLTAE